MDMPSTYTQDNYQNQNSVVDVTYVKDVKGWVRIAEIVLSLITFICATVAEVFVKEGSGAWVQFVSITAFIIGIILMIFHLFRIMQQLPSAIPTLLVELGFAAVWTLFYFIAGIVAAVKAGEYQFEFAGEKPAIEACAFFCFASLVAFGGDSFLFFMAWRANNSAGVPPPSTTATSHQTPTVTTTTPAPPVSGGATTGGNYDLDTQRSDKSVY